MIGKVIKNIDPRFFKVATMSVPSEEELRRPFLYRYMCQIPEQGKFTFLDAGWMEQTTQEVLNKKLEGEDYEKRIESIHRVSLLAHSLSIRSFCSSLSICIKNFSTRYPLSVS